MKLSLSSVSVYPVESDVSIATGVGLLPPQAAGMAGPGLIAGRRAINVGTPIQPVRPVQDAARDLSNFGDSLKNSRSATRWPSKC